jgi:SAM-dependent methyltransferase
VDIVRARLPRVDARVADVRALPFPDGSFDTVLSNSTLDHFASPHDIATALTELHRVLRSGGRLIVTLDNPFNPAVALRNVLPPGFLRRSGLAPFAVGATCGPRRLRAMLEDAHFKVNRLGAVFHAPRVLVVLGGHALDRFAGPSAQLSYARFWTAFEALDRLPTRFLTGHFVAALAHRT